MANALYDTGRNAFLSAGVNWTTDTIRCSLIHNSSGGTSYTPNLATDQFFSIVPSAAVVSGPVTITSPTAVAGVAGCANVVFTSVAGGVGKQVDGILFYKDTGNSATSQLIAYLDTATGLPVAPNGSNITINIDTGPNKLFKL